jgi:hypothetical protein
MPVTEPTPEELTQMTTRLSETFLKSVKEIFSSPEMINDAVLFRGMLIDEPAKGNIATLETVASQFDSAGNKIEGERFTYHEDERAKREIGWLAPDNISEREKIAVTSAYFKAGVDMLANIYGVAYVSKLADIIRPTIANELKNVMGFVSPNDYTPKQEMADKIDYLLQSENMQALVKKVLSNMKVIPEFKKGGEEAKAFAQGHLQKQLDKLPEEEKESSKALIKQKLLMRTHKAVEDFTQSCNPDKLFEQMTAIKRENDNRPGRHGFKTDSTDIINSVTRLAQKLFGSRNNSLTLESQKPSHEGMFGKTSSASSSPPKSPSPASPRGINSDYESDNEDKKSQPRKKSI